MKSMFFRVNTQEIAINERLAAYLFLPESTITYCKVNPWLLCTVMAQVRQIRTCKREKVPFLPSQVCLIDEIETTFSSFELTITGPA